MRGCKLATSILAVALAALLSSAAAAMAAPAPAWDIHSIAVPTHFAPEGSEKPFYEVSAVNSGAATTNGSTIVLTDTLPPGIGVDRVELPLRSDLEGVEDFGPTACETSEAAGVTTVRCEISTALPDAIEPTLVGEGESLRMFVFVTVPGAAAGALSNSAAVAGGGALPAAVEADNEASTQPAVAGLSEFRAALTGEAGETFRPAGSRPYQYTTSFAVNTEPGPPGGAPFVPAGGDIKTIEVALPAGLIGNPTSTSHCSAEEFNASRTLTIANGHNLLLNDCPDGSAVGFIHITQLEGKPNNLYQSIYNLDPPIGMPAQLGFRIAGAPFFIDTAVRTDGDYGITAFLPNTSEVKRVTAASVTLWGVPGAAKHNLLRGECLTDEPAGNLGLSTGSCPAGNTPSAFFTTPTSCSSPLDSIFSFDTWSNPGVFVHGAATAANPTGCDALDFSPSISVVPQTTVADSPTGLSVNLHVPQDQSPAGSAEANLRDAVVTLPRGVTINSAAATGLVGCSPAQVGLTSAAGVAPVAFDKAPAVCPDAAKVGSVEIDTPLLDHPILGSVYVATQAANPFGSLIAIYVAAFDPRTGVVIKLAGHVEPDLETGQLTTHFDNNPQLPFEDLHLIFFEGPRAPLRTPTVCGTYTTTSQLKPWSAPESGPDATPSDSFAVSTAPGGGACAATEGQQPNAPSFQAGTETPLAGAFSPFVLRLRREDGSQQLRELNLTLPPGLLGRLAGIPYCSDAQIAAAGQHAGAAERQSPSCPLTSQVGSVTVGVGAGAQPFLAAGNAYLAGPYKGAPLSLAIVTPAVAGPLDLGTVVVRSALFVDESTAQITVKSDPLPTILQGIPLDIRTVAVRVDRDGFTLNPTSCEQMSVSGTAISPTGAVAPLSNRFQVGGCRGLDFSPKLSLSLKGGTKRASHPALKAILTQPGGQANIGRASVTLPPSEFIDQDHVGNPCTRPQFTAGKCPPISVLGTATAYSPLLDQPLTGKVYFRANGGARTLPDIVADLNGQIHIVLVGFVDSVRRKGSEESRIRTTFAVVPDAPVAKFVLSLKGGGGGLLENSRNLCRGSQKASVKMTAQNGKTRDFDQPITTSCRKSGRKK